MPVSVLRLLLVFVAIVDANLLFGLQLKDLSLVVERTFSLRPVRPTLLGDIIESVRNSFEKVIEVKIVVVGVRLGHI
jgi:hypothetical protein